jgi:hypothetical protein
VALAASRAPWRALSCLLSLALGATSLAACGGGGGGTDAGRIVPPGCGAAGDADGDGVCDPDDACRGFDDGEDLDEDGVPDECDCDAYGDLCDPNARCADGDEGITCTCNAGFVGDGLFCEDGAGLDAGRPDAGLGDAGPMDAGTPASPALALLVDAEGGRPVVASVDETGRLVEARTTRGDTVTGYDFATGVLEPDGVVAHVLFYATAAGGGRLVSIDTESGMVSREIASVSLSAGWDHIVPIGSDGIGVLRLVFHDTETRTLAVLEFDRTTGSWVTTQTDTAAVPDTVGYDEMWRMAWDDGGASYVGLYQAVSGALARLAITNAGSSRGRFVRDAMGVPVMDLFGTTVTGLDHAAPTGETGYLAGTGRNDEVFLDGDDGSAVLVRVRLGSSLETRMTWGLGSFSAWSDVLTLENGYTLFYEQSAGTGAIGEFDAAATPVFRQTDTITTLASGYDHVTPLVVRP